MSKETLQHTMRSKVRVFEDGGIRLLRKGQKGLIHAIFSRFGLVLVLVGIGGYIAVREEDNHENNA